MISAEFLHNSLGKYNCQHSLSDHPRGRDDTDIASFDMGLNCFAGP